MSADIVSTATGTGDAATRSVRVRRSGNPFLALGTRRALISIAIALAIWEIGSRPRLARPRAAHSGRCPIAGLGGNRMVATRARSRLLAKLVLELPARAAWLFGGHARRRSFWAFPRDQQDLSRNCLSGLRIAAPDPTSRLGARLDHLLADAGAFDRFRHLPRCLLHDRTQCAWWRQVDRHPPDPGRALDGRDTQEYFPAASFFPPLCLRFAPAWKLALESHGKWWSQRR